MNTQDMILSIVKELKQDIKNNSKELQRLKLQINTLQNKSNFTTKGLMVAVGIISTVVSGITVVLLQKML